MTVQDAIRISTKALEVDTGNGWQELAIVVVLMVLGTLLFVVARRFLRS